jgi:hypothetical protein
LNTFLSGTAVDRMDWWDTFEPTNSAATAVQHVSGQPRTLEEWVWQTLESVAGGASVRPVDEDDEQVSVDAEECHLVSMVSSITFASR